MTRVEKKKKKSQDLLMQKFRDFLKTNFFILFLYVHDKMHTAFIDIH